jgi:hypothetical protein
VRSSPGKPFAISCSRRVWVLRASARAACGQQHQQCQHQVQARYCRRGARRTCAGCWNHCIWRGCGVKS